MCVGGIDTGSSGNETEDSFTNTLLQMSGKVLFLFLLFIHFMLLLHVSPTTNKLTTNHSVLYHILTVAVEWDIINEEGGYRSTEENIESGRER